MLGTKFLKVSPRGSKLLKGYILVRFLSCFILSCKAAVRYAGLFFWGCKQSCFCFQVSCCPVKRGNQAGSSRNEFDYLRRGTQDPDQFPVYRLSQLREFRTSSFFNFLPRKKKVIRAPFLINCKFSHNTYDKWTGPKFSQLWLSRSGKLIWVPLQEYSFRLNPRRIGSISSLYGAKTNFKAKRFPFST